MHRRRFRRDHRWAPGQMSAYHDGELAPDSVARMRRHVAECRDCRRLLAGLRELIVRLGGLAPPAQETDARYIAVAVRGRLRDQLEPFDG